MCSREAAQVKRERVLGALAGVTAPPPRNLAGVNHLATSLAVVTASPHRHRVALSGATASLCVSARGGRYGDVGGGGVGGPTVEVAVRWPCQQWCGNGGHVNSGVATVAMTAAVAWRL